MAKKLISKVWLLKGLFGKMTAGALIWSPGRIAFITEEGLQFDEPLAAIGDIRWPFLRMGLGFDAVINGKKFRFSFSKPNPSAPEIKIINGNPFPSVIFAGQYADDISSLRDLKADRLTTKLWKEIFAMRKDIPGI